VGRERIGYLRELVRARIGRMRPRDEAEGYGHKAEAEEGDRSVEVIALVNSGYETVEPELLVPAPTAQELGLLPVLPPGSAIREHVLADGSTAKLIRVSKALLVSVV